MKKKYFSFQEYSQETLFIPILFPNLNINNITIIENTDTIENIVDLKSGVWLGVDPLVTDQTKKRIIIIRRSVCL